MKGHSENRPHGRMGEKNKAPFGHTDGTHGKIEAHMRKHKARGGFARGGGQDEPESGDDQAKEDLGKKNMEYTKDSNVNRESEEMKAKRGGKMKRKSGGMCEGKSAMKHGGRKPRASGGAAEDHPFTTAYKSKPTVGHKTEREADCDY